MKNQRYLQNVENNSFQIQYAMYAQGAYVFPEIPEGFEEVDTQEARQWHQNLINAQRAAEAAYYEKNTTRFD